MTLNYVITGSSRGIGLELTRQVLDAGQVVFALARDPGKSKSLVELQKKFPDHLKIFAVDVSSDLDVKNFILELGNRQVDVLINNAGVYLEDPEDFKDLSLKKVEESFKTNTLGPIRMTQSLLGHLKQSSSPKVVNMTSLMGSIEDNESGGSYSYRISKTALNMFTKSFAVDYPKIVSLVIHPGWVKTDMGGAGALVDTKTSVSEILKVIAHAKHQDSGKFFDFEGDILPW